MENESYSDNGEEFLNEEPIQDMEDPNQNIQDEGSNYEDKKKQRSIIHSNYTLNKESNKYHCNHCR